MCKLSPRASGVVFRTDSTHARTNRVNVHPWNTMRYMIVEHFRNGDAAPIYKRYRERGRLAPAGLTYVESWVTADLRICFQIMECEDPALLQEWMDAWKDLVDFEVHPVISSSEAASRALHQQSSPD